MSSNLFALIERYHSRGILLDTNILLLYLIGKFDPSRIKRFKRTAKFSDEDFEILSKLLVPFRTIRTLPHVLAEVNSLSSQLPEDLLYEFRHEFAEQVEALDEGFHHSSEAVRRPEFAHLGLTDCEILIDSARGELVLTDDLQLFLALTRVGVDVLNFNHIRSFGTT